MYLAKLPEKIKHVAYESCPGVRVSDHKPVRAQFSVEVRIVDQDKKMDVYHTVTSQLDALENKAIPNLELSVNQVGQAKSVLVGEFHPSRRGNSQPPQITSCY